MSCTVCGSGEVVRAPPNVVDDELEVIRRRWDVDHRLEALRARPVMYRVVSYSYEIGLQYLLVIWRECRILAAYQPMFDSRGCITDSGITCMLCSKGTGPNPVQVHREMTTQSPRDAAEPPPPQTTPKCGPWPDEAKTERANHGVEEDIL
jgi:hypothetical protein